MSEAVADIEAGLLIDAIYRRYGYDFRGYSEASLKRRLTALMLKSGAASLSLLQHEILHKPEFFAAALADLTVTTSELFRDPAFFRTLREQVFPVLRTYPTFKVWHAGCSTGEEVYSLAIALKEAGLYDRAVIYATDLNPAALRVASEGIYQNEAMKLAPAAYLASGGLKRLEDYCTEGYGAVRFDKALRENIVFSEHNLVTDDVFSEMNLILCRNVLIYFKRDLQDRVLDLFSRSLIYKGFLCLGTKETVRFLKGGDDYGQILPDTAIFQKRTLERTGQWGET